MPFSPPDLGATLKLWLKGDGTLWQDSGRTTPASADADPVGAWDDASGNARHALQATAGNRPLFKTAILNGKPVLRFDGADDCLGTASVAVANLTATLFMVCNPSNVAENRCPVLNGDDGAGNGYGIATSTGGAGKIGRLRAGIAWDSTATNAATGWAIYGMTQSTGACEVFLGGVSLGTFTSNPNNPTARVAVGNHQFGVGSAFSFAGDIAEIIVYDTSLNTTDRQSVEGYLNVKYFGAAAGGGLLLKRRRAAR